jgi:hypothetical protein
MAGARYNRNEVTLNVRIKLSLVSGNPHFSGIPLTPAIPLWRFVMRTQ